MAARLLVEQGHQVVLHARSQARAERGADRRAGRPDAAVVGDLVEHRADPSASPKQTNLLGRFDAVIHNAGIGYRERHRIATEDGLPDVFAINTLAPYILTALTVKPKRSGLTLVSGMYPQSRHQPAGHHLD